MGRGSKGNKLKIEGRERDNLRLDVFLETEADVQITIESSAAVDGRSEKIQPGVWHLLPDSRFHIGDQDLHFPLHLLSQTVLF